MPLTKVSSGVIAANAVVDSFGTQSITGDKLGLTAINANNIVNASITGAKIALGTITGDDIATGQITGNLLTANCVSGNNIVDGAVTVPKGGTGLSTLTANNILIGNGTSPLQFIAPGTSANVLTSNGTNWISSAAASGSPIVLLSSNTTPASVATVSFSGFDGSTYIAYMIQIQGVRPSSDNGQLRMRLRNSSGTITATDYHNGLNTTRSDSGFSFAATSGTDYFNITSPNVRSSTAGGCQGIIFVSQSVNATPSFNSMISWWAPPDNVSFQSIAGGAMNSTQSGVVITGFDFFYASGNITSASKITVYGLKAS